MAAERKAKVSKFVEEPATSWTFLTNHSHVLILIARNPEVLMREVALEVGITERAVHRIIAELEQGGYLQREKSGRRNTYQINPDLPLRHAIEQHRSVGDLLVLAEEAADRKKKK